MAKEADQDRLFLAALSEGSEEAIGAWIASGPEAVRRLYAELSGEDRVELPDGLHSRDFLDNLTWSCHLLGAAYPNEFIETFESAKWSTNPFVISGLGGTLKPEATRRLIRLMANEDEWVRINAVVAFEAIAIVACALFCSQRWRTPTISSGTTPASGSASWRTGLVFSGCKHRPWEHGIDLTR